MKIRIPARFCVMALFLPLVQPASAIGAERVPQPKVEKKKEVPPVLTMEIHAVNGGMEAKFENHTNGDVGVKVGKQLIALKPGETGTFPIRKREELSVFEKIRREGADEWRPRLRTMIFPRPAKAQYLGPG